MSRSKHVFGALAASVALAASAAPLVPSGTNDTAALVAALAASPTGTVELAAGVFLIDAELAVSNGVTLKGQGRGKTVIRQTAADARCVRLDGGSRLEAVTLTGGRLKAASGAGVLVGNGTVAWCGIVSNTVVSAAGISGAGVSFSGGRGGIDHSVVFGNRIESGSGAGIGGSSPAGPVSVDTCLVYANESDGGAAGGIDFDAPAAPVMVRHCTVADNSAVRGSGGIRLKGEAGRFVLFNDIFACNRLELSEANILAADGSVDLSASKGCLFGLASESDESGIPGSQYGFPAFVNALNGDYRLRTPTKTGCEDHSGALVDIDGVFRSGPVDVGCYERVSMPSSAILGFE